MLQQEQDEDFIIATGELNSFEYFIDTAFNHLGLSWRNHVIQNEEFMRPSDLQISFGYSSKAIKLLKRRAQYNMRDVSKMMIDGV